MCKKTEDEPQIEKISLLDLGRRVSAGGDPTHLRALLRRIQERLKKRKHRIRHEDWPHGQGKAK